MSFLSQLQLPAHERRAYHHRSQGFGFKNGYATQNEDAPGIAGEELTSTKILLERDMVSPPPTETYNPKLTFGTIKRPDPQPNPPPTVVYDKVVLRFDCYFMESVHESPDETYRVRKCLLEFFPEDESMLITEVVWDNSGMPQGKIIKRQRLPKVSLHVELFGNTICLTFDQIVLGSHVYLCPTMYNSSCFSRF
eukprot:TRINITY_DN1225_c0_g2_i4.p1 TRINITY_DN1225_c0_g2~~TRINITY_DN1225_c0_g2_i4.p1  ORF type:complete len:194 (+),score=23.15 TRINITY_DN1225_c0_g2_i4:179-760(+)